MAKTSSKRAYQAGYEDGQASVTDEIVFSGRLPSHDEVESWFGLDKSQPDEALFSALGREEAALALGVRTKDIEDRTARFEAACDAYNRGFIDGALDAAEEGA